MWKAQWKIWNCLNNLYSDLSICSVHRVLIHLCIERCTNLVGSMATFWFLSENIRSLDFFYRAELNSILSSSVCIQSSWKTSVLWSSGDNLVWVRLSFPFIYGLVEEWEVCVLYSLSKGWHYCGAEKAASLAQIFWKSCQTHLGFQRASQGNILKKNSTNQYWSQQNHYSWHR